MFITLIVIKYGKMAKFLDSHPMNSTKKEELEKMQNEPKDEFGVSHLNIIFSENDDRMYCFLDAPNKDAVIKHHSKHGFKCDFIIEVNSTS